MTIEINNSDKVELIGIGVDFIAGDFLFTAISNTTFRNSTTRFSVRLFLM
jgi:hypothetical protein